MVREGTAPVVENDAKTLFPGYMSLSSAQSHGEIRERVRVRFPNLAGLVLETAAG